MTSGFAIRRATGVLLLAVVVGASAPGAQETGDSPPAPRARVVLRPGVARLGERVIYRVELTPGHWSTVRWLPPDSSEVLSWGEPRSGRTRARTPARRVGDAARGPGTVLSVLDTVWIEMPLQAFTLGAVDIPGLRFEYLEQAHQRRTEGRGPVARLVVMPVMTTADSQATLREVHGPLAAPWWERVPWVLVIAGVLALTGIVLLLRWLRRRRALPQVAVPVRAQSPAERALAALAELRARRLPEQDRVPEHAFHLGQILRRYLEATIGTPLPGDTTGELVRRLERAGLGTEDVRRVATLMRGWDQVKFARQPATRDEALRTEAAVEAYVRRGTSSGVPAPQREVA